MELETRIKIPNKLINKNRPQQCEPGREKMRVDPDGEIEKPLPDLSTQEYQRIHSSDLCSANAPVGGEKGWGETQV